MAEVLAAMRRLAIKPPGGTAAGSGSLEYPQYTVEVTKEEVQAAMDKVEELVSAKRNDDKLENSVIGAKRDISRPPEVTGATSTAVNRLNQDEMSSRSRFASGKS